MEAVIIDAIVLVVLLGFTLYGIHKGLFRALVGLLIIVFALVGAGLFAKTLAQPATDLFKPMLAERIERRVDAALEAQTAELPELELHASEAVEAVLDLLGMDPQTIESLSEKAGEKLQETGAGIASAIAESLLYSVLYGVLFLLAFLALLLCFRLAARAFDLVLKLPILHGLNCLGGAAFGLAEGGLLLFLLIWAARRFGVSFETETVAATHLLRFFTTNTPLSVLSFLL